MAARSHSEKPICQYLLHQLTNLNEQNIHYELSLKSRNEYWYRAASSCNWNRITILVSTPMIYQLTIPMKRSSSYKFRDTKLYSTTMCVLSSKIICKYNVSKIIRFTIYRHCAFVKKIKKYSHVSYFRICHTEMPQYFKFALWYCSSMF